MTKKKKWNAINRLPVGSDSFMILRCYNVAIEQDKTKSAQTRVFFQGGI